MTFNQLIINNQDLEHIVRKLIIHNSKLTTSEIFKKIDEEIDFDLKVFKKQLFEYKSGKPLEYILGYTHFLDLKILVEKGVFIPRPETEMLSELVIEEIDELFSKEKILIGDVCSGSGAIALALNKHTNNETYGLELSDEALGAAKKNNETNKCDVKFVKSDIDKYLIDNNIKLDVLVSNPPYIKPDSKLDTRVVDHEPHMALFDKNFDGLSFYDHILQNHNITTKTKSIIAFEFGYDQSEGIELLIKKHIPNCSYHFVMDYQDHIRGVIIIKK